MAGANAPAVFFTLGLTALNRRASRSFMVEALADDLTIFPAPDGYLHHLHRAHALQLQVILPLRERGVTVRRIRKHLSTKLSDTLLHLLPRTHPRLPPDPLGLIVLLGHNILRIEALERLYGFPLDDHLIQLAV